MEGRYTFYKTIIVLATLIGAFLLYQLGETVVVLFAAIIVASAIRPIVNALEARGLQRGMAILLVYLAMLSSLIVLLVIAIPPLVGLAMEIFQGDLLVRQARYLAARLALFGWDTLNIQWEMLVPVFELPEQLRVVMEQAPEAARAQALPAAQTVGLVLANLLLALVMGFYWLTARDQMLSLLLRITPLRHRERLSLLWSDIEETLGAWVRGQTLLCVTIGIASFVGLVVLRVPYAVPLAVIAGLTEAIPMVGPIIGAVPAVLVAFTVSPTTGLLVIILYIIVQQLENNVLVPRIMEQSVGLNPLVVIVAIIAGGALKGIVGGLLAIPVAGALQVIARHLLIEPALQSQAPRVAQGVTIFPTEQGNEDDGEDDDDLTIVVPVSMRS